VPELARHDWAAVLDDLTVRVITRGDLLAVLGGLLEHRHPTRLGHVLAATSLRPSAARVLDEALRIAEATGAAVTALHVRPARMGAHGPEGATAAAVVKVERVRRHIADPVDAVGRREQRVHDVQGEVGEGPVAREIVRRAEELDSDLIVMGAAGARGRFLDLLEPLATLLDEDAPGDDAGEPTPGRPSPARASAPTPPVAAGSGPARRVGKAHAERERGLPLRGAGQRGQRRRGVRRAPQHAVAVHHLHRLVDGLRGEPAARGQEAQPLPQAPGPQGDPAIIEPAGRGVVG